MREAGLGASRASFQGLADRPQADVLVVGGGINGAAVFRDLALQGVDVILVDRGDFSAGASAASSHMVHGGLRYLENGEFRLVQEAVRERNDLLRTAPHAVRPLRTTIPLSSTFGGLLTGPLRFLRLARARRSPRGAVLVETGLTVYDTFSRGGMLPRHRMRGRRAALRRHPDLRPDTRYTATYWDASALHPERLALEMVRDGLVAGRERARAANYAEVAGAADGTVIVRDGESGQETRITASVVVNASGPWADLTNAALGLPTAYLGGTKGSHIVLDDDRLLAATAGDEIFFEHDDGRIVLIYPLHGRVLVGTTDLEHDMRTEAVCTDAEVDYFVELIEHVLPGIPVDRSRIVYRYSGVRPLPRHGDTDPGLVSRDYRVESGVLPGAERTRILTLVGGKWTTFRASAEHVADRALAALGRPRRLSTRGLPIGGGWGMPRSAAARERWIAEHRGAVGAERARVLLERYGTAADRVIAAVAADPADAPLTAAPEYSTAELRHLAATEHVTHLDDLLRRRTLIGFRHGVTEETAREAAAVVADVLDWDEEHTDAEVQRVLGEAAPGGQATSTTPIMPRSS